MMEGKLDTVKQIRLEDIGVVWDLKRKQQWENNFNLLVKYKDHEGHYNVPQKHKEDGQNLGQWLANQRLAKKKDKLEKVRKQRLDDLGVVWSLKK